MASSVIDGLNTTAMLDDNMETNATNMSERGTLLSFKPTQSMSSSWGELSGEEFIKATDDVYSPVVHWRPKFFWGHVGSNLWQSLHCIRLFNAFTPEADREAIALKAAMTYLR